MTTRSKTGVVVFRTDVKGSPSEVITSGAAYRLPGLVDAGSWSNVLRPHGQRNDCHIPNRQAPIVAM